MTTTIPEHRFIARSIELAVESGAAGDRPFGAVFVGADGAALAEGRNEATSTGDVTAHAEIVAIRQAATAGLSDRFPGSVMYASGEPCPMCAAACVWAGVVTIVFAASTTEFSRILPGGPQFRLSCAKTIDATDADIEVIGPICQEDALQAMRSAVAPSH
ncbi:MAG: nucleoside deaminase [Mycobacterium sp.]